MIIFCRLSDFQKAVISGASDADFPCEDILISEQQRKSCCRLCLFGEFVKMNPSPVPKGFCLWQKRVKSSQKEKKKDKVGRKKMLTFFRTTPRSP